MKTRALTPVEIAIAAGAVIVVGILLWLAVGYQQRQVRDTQRLLDIRTIQATLEAFRGQRASYPGSADGIPKSAVGATPFAYAATPDGCGENDVTLCTGYTLTFQLEGAIGGLKGGRCSAGPQGIACGK